MGKSGHRVGKGGEGCVECDALQPPKEVLFKSEAPLQESEGPLNGLQLDLDTYGRVGGVGVLAGLEGT